ncbi:zinc-ribbon domain-containing protein [Pseudoalteromonas luteoviolacea]|uniref:zinc-ribbon domain-containing protein n=1 Tax=Pseudoalteromonas luteoviolacea TaxID=43657 RepID=UPI0007B043B7|nr:zinc-ribbon domain-containing protein [Pseudoalteromonas luteoviolacea]KZN53215.1 hypothetical protein N474_21130 [Pseudoalteromonas luteoviolacea CPMOR-2]TQF67872.1 hypothetical protein FLM44_22085 [Pseudoalteromonas luteoviolacea]
MTHQSDKNSYVYHPLYGSEPIPSEFDYSTEEVASAHWRYRSLKFFRETAIPANINKQNFALFPRSLYVDIEEECVDCHRLFIFYALEQKYWFEELRFWVDAHCIRCIECRKKDQEIKNMQRRYGDLVSKENRTNDETAELKSIALELYQLGYMKNIHKVNKIS